MEQVYQGLGRVIIVNIPVGPQSRADDIERLERQRVTASLG